MRTINRTIPTLKTTLRNRNYTIYESCITPYFSPKMRFIPSEDEKPHKEFLEVGKLYSLRGTECDDFVMPTKTYELIKNIDSVDGVELDAVVMKQIDGEQSTIFSLTKNDCRKLNIPFSSGLQLFPRTMEWDKVQTEEETKKQPQTPREFDSHNLSTYPPSYHDKLIHYMTIKMSNFMIGPNGIIVTPNGIHINQQDFLNSLRVTTKQSIGVLGSTKAAYLPNGFNVSWRLVTNMVTPNQSNSELIDSLGCVYIELIFEQNRNGETVGVHPDAFRQGTFDDFFKVWYPGENALFIPKYIGQHNNDVVVHTKMFDSWEDIVNKNLQNKIHLVLEDGCEIDLPW